LAKPADMDDARLMLRRLSGRTHQVRSGVAVVSADAVRTFAVITNVTFKSLTENVIAAYHAKVNVLDKAGGYAVQEHGDLIVERVDGSRTNVIGLPMDEVSAVLTALVSAHEAVQFDMKPYYITTAIDYTNAAPHIGHAYEKVLADVMARYQRLVGNEVYFLTGVDQHGQKVQKSR